MSNRRTDKVSGWVDFPINRDGWRNSKEGGTFVRLVVIPKSVPGQYGYEGEDEWMQCCGGANFCYNDEIYITNKENEPEFPEQEVYSLEEYGNTLNEISAYRENQVREIFPRYNTDHLDSGISRDFLAVMTIGSTGWSGENDNLDIWECKFEDLTDEGKTLFRMMEKLYPNCTVKLLTFLDT